MKISIIGNGNVGSALARRFTQMGHDVTVANSTTPPAQAAAQAAAADIVVLAVRFRVVAQLDAQVKAALDGKIVIDATNPQTPDFMALTIGHTTSAGEQVAAALPGTRVVKAFNTIFAANLEVPDLGGSPQFLPVASDDDMAKKTVIDLGVQLGFDAVDAGPLANARYLEPAVELLVHLAYGSGLGGGIGYTLARA
ncbi:NADPH-dependent F420 reductase [Nonomuraea turcica]|uniref:NADPH-dependent F420 reductase n=1 Tax=Nonomuraea sp. G32 TaxID=3067274 RepID=UPI00273C52B2|nr:NADPH-dependent F420 reductase [Nonomuraea sp. G32]MDP4511040.1 NADPH-dependent F420 reductase [Nonomuraea sp. G32]